MSNSIYKIAVVLLSLVCSFELSAQQQQHYTFFMHNKLLLNPGYAGAADHSYINLIYRNQWSGLPGAPEAQSLTWNMSSFNKVGLGFVADRQTIGIQEEVSIAGNYAYKLLLNDLTISAGLSGSYRRYTEDFTDPSIVAIHSLNTDPSIPQLVYNKNIINVGFGIYASNKDFYLGVSIPRLIKTSLDIDNNSFLTQEELHYYLMGGIDFRINKKLKFSPQVLLKFAQNSPFDIDLNFGVSWEDKYGLALAYRYGGNDGGIGESVDLMFTFKLNEALMFGVSQDYSLSDLSSYESGTLEAMVQYDFVKKKPQPVMVNPRYFY